MTRSIQFELNNEPTSVEADGERKLLWVLRHDLGLTGTKYGCGSGYCGSCTVLVNGEPVRSCRMPLEMAAGKKIVTIEGLAGKDGLHPLQKAFMEHDAFQCGYCTPGMILEAAGFLRKNPKPAHEEIVRAMDRNLCRCGAHTRIVRAIQAAALEMSGGAKSGGAKSGGARSGGERK